MIELLKRVSIFDGASPELLAQVAGSLHPLSVQRGEVVCRMGEPGSTLFLIRCGQVRISIREGDGREITLGYLGPGDYFGEMSLLTGEPISADVTATLPTDLSALEGECFRQICDENPILYRGISRTLSHRLRETNLRRFESRRGRVTRFIEDRKPERSEKLRMEILRLAEILSGEVGKTVLLLMPTDVSFLDSPAGVFGERGLFPTDQPQLDPTVRAVLSDLTADYPEHRSRFYKFPGGVDVLLWASPWGGREWECEHSLNDILSRFSEVYAHIQVCQIGWRLEAMLGQVPQEDHVAFLVDFCSEECLREAKRQEYDRFVPEGYRFPPAADHTYWTLTQASLDRIAEIERVVRERLSEPRQVHVLLLHPKDCPLLNFPLVRMMLPDCSVHPLPSAERSRAAAIPAGSGARLLERSEGSARSTALNHEVRKPPSRSIALGLQPQLARERIARDLSGRLVGLALGGGGARGLAHIGVIKVLEEEGIPIDLLAGSSFGSVVAAAYGIGRSAERLLADMKYHWGRLGNFLLDILDYSIPRTALLRGRKIRQMIEIAMAEQTIEECPTPVYVVCTDLITGREVVLERGRLGKAIWASGSLPGIFSPVRWDQYLLVDGAVLNKVPARVLREKGARVVIAVNVTPERDSGLETANGSRSLIRRCLDHIPPVRRWLSGPNILRIVSRSISVSGLHLSRIHKDAIDVEIRPRVEQFDFLRFDQFDQIVEAGMDAARKALPEIREALMTR